MEIVKCEPFHWNDVLEIRNENHEGFGDTEIITASVHYLYMTQHSKNYLICTHLKRAIGFIGHVDNDIRLATRKEYQRRGVAKLMLEEFQKKFPNCIAKVKKNNKASLKLFESCGFIIKYYILTK